MLLLILLNANNLTQLFSISDASLYRLIDTLKEMGAPIEFSVIRQSYTYSSEVNFMCGFFLKELSRNEIQKVNGGFQNLAFLLNFNDNNSLTLRI